MKASRAKGEGNAYEGGKIEKLRKVMVDGNRTKLGRGWLLLGKRVLAV